MWTKRDNCDTLLFVKKEETGLQKEILDALAKHPRVGFIGRNTRGQFKTKWGGVVWAGLCNGATDLCGYLTDGRALFIEVKTPKGALQQNQAEFLENARKCGCCVGVARSVEEALSIVDAACDL